MAISAKFIRHQLEMWRSVITGCTLETARSGQEKLGDIMAFGNRGKVTVETVKQQNCEAVMVTPQDETRDAVMLYLHGGGYCSGDISYTTGVASYLSAKLGIKVFAPAYRLAPESPFPAALQDSLAAYDYLTKIGYSAKNIVICGESAGGGLLFSLCFLLRDTGDDLPAGILAFSPWTDLTASGASYETNRENDPSMTKKRLDFFADNYTTDKTDPLVSPFFGDLRDLPDTLMLVGGSEIMLDDTCLMHEKLLAAGVNSEMVVARDMWHGYILYNTAERAGDFNTINKFLDRVLPPPRKLRWMKLDNAAKIYPAARRRNWSNVFRLSAELTENIDCQTLQTALDITVRRFPSMAVKLCKGAFWYYLEELNSAPIIREDVSYPVQRMAYRDLSKSLLRVLVYKNRIACEFFHSITDGNGGLIFLKTLVAEYLELKYNISIPCECGILDRREEPDEAELEDSFIKYSGSVTIGRMESDAYQLRGERELGDYNHLISFIASSDEVHRAAKSYKVSITAFLCAAMMQAIINIQERKVPNINCRKPVKVLLPVNLRKMFPSKTLRNFVLYITPEVNPRMGEYTFEEICRSVYHQMGMELTPKRMGARFTTNVNSEKSFIIKIMPLFIKNLVMKMVFSAVGERKSCLTLSNLGMAQIPEEMKPYVERFDFVLSPPATSAYNSSVISYGDKMILSIVRNSVEPELERELAYVLRDLGIHLKVESNDSPERSDD